MAVPGPMMDAVPKQNPPVTLGSYLNDTLNKIECIRNQVAELESRLNPVLIPSNPPDNKLTGIGLEPALPAALEMASNACRKLDSLSALLSEILERIRL